MNQKTKFRLSATLALALSIILLGLAALGLMQSGAAQAVRLKIPTDCGVISCTTLLPFIAKYYPVPPNLEVTQGVQQLDNSVTLIASRTTYVRSTLTSSTAHTGVSAMLHGSRGGVPLSGSPLTALNNPRTLKSTADRSVLDDTFNFALPASWASGTIGLSVSASNGSTYSLASGSEAFTFVSADPLKVTIVPVAYTCTSDGSGTTSPPDSPFSYLTGYTLQTFPVPSVSSMVHIAMPFSGPCASGVPDPTGGDWSDMLTAITDVWFWDGSPDEYYYALVHVDCAISCIAGIGWIGNYKAAVGFDGFGGSHISAGETHAHEVGHNHNRRHAPGCGATGVDGGFPYTSGGTGYIGNSANQNYGFNIDTPAIYPYSTYIDFMSYCGPEWISDYTYEALRSWAALIVGASAAPVSNEGTLLLSGSFDADSGAVTFNPAYVVDIPTRIPQHGDHMVELLNANGDVIASYAFEPVTAIADQYRQGTAFEIESFHLALPYTSDLAAVRIRRGDALLGTLQRGARAPVFDTSYSALGIEGASLQVNWSASDADGESLTYAVRVSSDDGATWQTVSVNQTDTSLQLNPSDFAGKSVLVQVLASDGLNTTAQQIGPFSIPPRD